MTSFYANNFPDSALFNLLHSQMANYKWRNYQAERLLDLRIWVNSATYMLIVT